MRFEQPELAESLEQHVQQEPLGIALDQPTAKLTQHGVVEPSVFQLEPEGVLPIDPCANRFGRLAIGQVLSELEDRNQRKSPLDRK